MRPGNKQCIRMNVFDIESVFCQFIQDVSDTRTLVILRHADDDLRHDEPAELLIHPLFGSGLDSDVNPVQNLIEQSELIQVALALGFV